MPDKHGASVQIQQMNMRIRGRSVEAGHRIANGVGRELARTLPDGESRRYGALNVRVPAADAASDSEISTAVADAIVRALHSD